MTQDTRGHLLNGSWEGTAFALRAAKGTPCGNSGSRIAHWASVRSMLLIYVIGHKFQPLSALNVFMR